MADTVLTNKDTRIIHAAAVAERLLCATDFDGNMVSAYYGVPQGDEADRIQAIITGLDDAFCINTAQTVHYIDNILGYSPPNVSGVEGLQLRMYGHLVKDGSDERSCASLLATVRTMIDNMNQDLDEPIAINEKLSCAFGVKHNGATEQNLTDIREAMENWINENDPHYWAFKDTPEYYDILPAHANKAYALQEIVRYHNDFQLSSVVAFASGDGSTDEPPMDFAIDHTNQGSLGGYQNGVGLAINRPNFRGDASHGTSHTDTLDVLEYALRCKNGQEGNPPDEEGFVEAVIVPNDDDDDQNNGNAQGDWVWSDEVGDWVWEQEDQPECQHKEHSGGVMSFEYHKHSLRCQ